MLESYKELIVWKKSIQLVKIIYRITSEFPKTEIYGMISQMRRASISIPSNIAEGYKRINLGEYIQFLGVADASAAELETQLIIAKELYPNVDYVEAEVLLAEIQKMLFSLITKLKTNRQTKP